MADYDKLLQVPRGTKARLEQIKLDLLVNTIVYATDTKELGIKLNDGNIEYFKNAADINAEFDDVWHDIDYIQSVIPNIMQVSQRLDDVESDVSQLDVIVDNVVSNISQLDVKVEYYNDTLDTSKQNKLIAGTNITIENNVISASDSEYELTKPKIDAALAGGNSGSLKLGENSVSDGQYSTAIGKNAEATTDYSIALGHGAEALGNQSIAIGRYAVVYGDDSIAIGRDVEVHEDNVVDFGYNRQVRVNETPANDRDAVSKKYLENVIGDIESALDAILGV